MKVSCCICGHAVELPTFQCEDIASYDRAMWVRTHMVCCDICGAYLNWRNMGRLPDISPEGEYPARGARE